MEFRWKASNFKISAQIVGDRIIALEQQHGVLHPRLLVEDAEPLSSPLHPLFEWDDTTAASAYRVQQARSVLQAIRVVYEGGHGEEQIAFVHVRTEAEGPGYVSMIRAMSDQQMRAQVLADCLGLLTGIQERYKELGEFQLVWRAIRRAMARIKVFPAKATAKAKQAAAR